VTVRIADGFGSDLLLTCAWLPGDARWPSWRVLPIRTGKRCADEHDRLTLDDCWSTGRDVIEHEGATVTLTARVSLVPAADAREAGRTSAAVRARATGGKLLTPLQKANCVPQRIRAISAWNMSS
jgi:hypothetical protein